MSTISNTMVLPKLNTKEQLILNELVHKYKLNKQSSDIDIIRLHERLVGNLIGKWGKKYIRRYKELPNLRTGIYSMLLYPLAYPSMRIKNNGLKAFRSFYWHNRLRPQLKTISQCTKSVGRLVKKDKNGKFISFCSGFRIGDNLLLTSIDALHKLKDRNIQITQQCWIDFSEDEKTIHAQNLFKIKQVIKPPKKPNQAFVLLVLEPSSRGGKKLPPPLQINKDFTNPNFVVTIGYPLKPQEDFEHPLRPHAIFGSPWQMAYKRIAPGHFRDGHSKMLNHDCSVAKGSEGSPIIHPKTGEVIAMHLRTEGNKKTATRIDFESINILLQSK